jgi:hypothetical protein
VTALGGPLLLILLPWLASTPPASAQERGQPPTPSLPSARWYEAMAKVQLQSVTLPSRIESRREKAIGFLPVGGGSQRFCGEEGTNRGEGRELFRSGLRSRSVRFIRQHPSVQKRRNTQPACSTWDRSPLAFDAMTLLARVIARPIDDTRCTRQIDPWVAQPGSGPHGRHG